MANHNLFLATTLDNLDRIPGYPNTRALTLLRDLTGEQQQRPTHIVDSASAKVHRSILKGRAGRHKPLRSRTDYPSLLRTEGQSGFYPACFSWSRIGSWKSQRQTMFMQHTVLLRLPEVFKGLRGFLGPLIFVCERDVDQSSNEPSAR